MSCNSVSAGTGRPRHLLRFSSPTCPPCEHLSLVCEALMTQDPLDQVYEGSSVDATLGSCYPQAGFTSREMTRRAGEVRTLRSVAWLDGGHHALTSSFHQGGSSCPTARVPQPSCHPVSWPQAGPSPGSPSVLARTGDVNGGPCQVVTVP